MTIQQYLKHIRKSLVVVDGDGNVKQTTGIYARHTFRKVSDTATATQVGQTAIAIKTLSLLLLRQEKREN